MFYSHEDKQISVVKCFKCNFGLTNLQVCWNNPFSRLLRHACEKPETDKSSFTTPSPLPRSGSYTVWCIYQAAEVKRGCRWNLRRHRLDYIKTGFNPKKVRYRSAVCNAQGGCGSRSAQTRQKSLKIKC